MLVGFMGAPGTGKTQAGKELKSFTDAVCQRPPIDKLMEAKMSTGADAGIYTELALAVMYHNLIERANRHVPFVTDGTPLDVMAMTYYLNSNYWGLDYSHPVFAQMLDLTLADMPKYDVLFYFAPPQEASRLTKEVDEELRTLLQILNADIAIVEPGDPKDQAQFVAIGAGIYVGLSA